MNSLQRYPKLQRSKIAILWANRSNENQAASKAKRDLDADTIYRRALDDARGQILREGICYKNGREIKWQVRRSVNGRTNQFDLVSNERVISTCGFRKIPKEFRPTFKFNVFQKNT